MKLKKTTAISRNIFKRGQLTPVRPSFLLTVGALVITILLAPVAMSQSRDRASSSQRIKFAIGAISTQVNGQFTPKNERVRFVIKAKAGDHMIVNVIPVTKTLTMAGTIKTPLGEGDGGPGGIILNSDLTASGDYIIEVFQHTMGSNLASGKFILEVVITPSWLKS
ncbi:MAG TPA: hypothetical protein VGN90_11585 [Pyrinomonadaceae bacterium]|jgi:hypothetical protein|nr:hypothetical protein [Pyrinomonadaceae bacterium]